MAVALKSWELENAVNLVDPQRDALYVYDAASQKAQGEARPWKNDPNFFRSVRISAVALLKMVMHARSGGSLEIMGLMQGFSQGNEIVVTDALRLPVEGTETRVNAGAEADEYSVQFLQRAREAGQLENVVGWYHSHPGYGCWLSGIDVTTQTIQQLNEPYIAVVIDPDRTVSAGKVEIGAFRTYPEGYKPPEGIAEGEGSQTIPQDKAQDFGMYASRYYSLEVSHFKSSLDTKLLESLWNKYWVGTLSSSPLFTNREYGTKQIADLAIKIQLATAEASKRSKGGPQSSGQGTEKESGMDTVVRAGNKIAAEEENGLLAARVKRQLFSDIGAASAKNTAT